MAKNVGTLDYEAGSSSHPKRHRDTETMEEAMLGRVYHQNLLWGGCNMKAKKDKCKGFVAETIEEKLEIKVIEIGGNEEIFSSKAWRRSGD
ncbi:hypothetical protein Tco_1042364 [Tanacetum coccineum]|uniref:Uncharacterized protein n=1 Tax=Tanacetum coccineum TaxID=301880 RepID=A0ABQ5GJM5_9ASTR